MREGNKGIEGITTRKKLGDGEYTKVIIFNQGLSKCMHKLSRPHDRMS
jgi:hypothetical protein